MGRPALSAVVLVALVAAAGCAGSPPAGDESDRTATEDPTETVLPRADYPEPPAELTNESLKRAVREYERARLQNRLRNESDATYLDVGYHSPVTVTLINRTATGAYLRLDGTYSWGNERVDADGAPVCSLYRVNESAVTYLGQGNCGED